MNLRRYVVEVGMGIDQHGQDDTKAAAKAVKNAIERVGLVGLGEIVRLGSIDDMVVEALVAVPHPERVREEEVLAALPLGRKSLKVIPGGMVARISKADALGDKTDEAIIANAAVTVLVDMDRVREAWKQA